jgi:uncharacterized protein
MILSLHVKPNSKTDQIEVDKEGGIKVKIRAQPIDGKANEYLETYLSSIFKVPRSHVIILKGITSQYKKVEIVGSESELTAILHEFRKP